jgi:hypothetical protein
MVKSRPKIILSAAVSVDGKIATRTHRSNLSSRKDKVRLHRLRSKVDAILVGKNTRSIAYGKVCPGKKSDKNSFGLKGGDLDALKNNQNIAQGSNHNSGL